MGGEADKAEGFLMRPQAEAGTLGGAVHSA